MRTTNGRSYQLKRTDKGTCNLEHPCYIGCWKDPVTKQFIRIGKNYNKLSDGDELNGQIEFLDPGL